MAEKEKDNRPNAPAVNRVHYQRMREPVTRKRLLEYELGSGWEPICRSLSRPVADEPFPHTNENVALQDRMDLVSRFGALNALKNVAMAANLVLGSCAGIEIDLEVIVNLLLKVRSAQANSGGKGPWRSWSGIFSGTDGTVPEGEAAVFRILG